MKMTFQEIRIIATGPCVANQLRNVNPICRRSWYISAHIWKIYDFKIGNIFRLCRMHFHIYVLSMCDVKLFLTFASLGLVLLWQLFYLFCSSIVINTVIVTAGTSDKISQQPENCENRNDPDLVQAFLKKWCVESDFKAPNLPLSLRLKGSGCHYNSIYNNTGTK
jgi:hypothetical protein